QPDDLPRRPHAVHGVRRPDGLPALPELLELSASQRLQDVPPNSTSLVSTVPAVRPGAVWYLQYRFVWAMTWSGGGAPHGVWSSVVCASLTSVASYPLTSAPWSVERMHASVWAPATTSRPTPRFVSTASRVVS